MIGNARRSLVVLGWVASFVLALAQEPPPVAHVVLVGDSTVTDAAGWGGAFARLLRPGVQKPLPDPIPLQIQFPISPRPKTGF